MSNLSPEYGAVSTASKVSLESVVELTDDGRVMVDLDLDAVRDLASTVNLHKERESENSVSPLFPPPTSCTQAPWTMPMSIVVQVVGSRGDVQPFVALGNELQKAGHRVRIATHSVFKTFVLDAGLEFFSIGGDPCQLMAYMVENPGLIPNIKTLRGGEIRRKRQMISEMLRGCWNSCIQPDEDSKEPFFANAIIANPVSFAHIHCAQALSVPLHLVFTMPWSPTKAFPHPLASVKSTTTDPKLANYLSYGLVQSLTWQGLAGVINKFRKMLNLEILPTSEAPFLAEKLKIPYTYCWSPALASKPKDWADHIDVSGFIFRKTPQYEPPRELAEFLSTGALPVYVGFGSIVVSDPQKLLATVLEAVKLSGVRAIIARGWSELSSGNISDQILFLGDCPHEWLFQHVSAVVHHGGAGTTAVGLLNGKPTTVIPFFGDQPFWGDRIAAAGAGPQPIPYKELNATVLAEAIRFCHTEGAMTAAKQIARQMSAERGVENAAASFHRHLRVESLRCDIIPSLPAVYTVSMKSKELKVSAVASAILVKHGKIKSKNLMLYRPSPIRIENHRWDPITSAGASAGAAIIMSVKAVNGFWYEPYRIHRKAAKHRKKTSKSTEGDHFPRDQKDEPASPTVLRLVSASAMSIPKHCGPIIKFMIIDTPLAITEGFRNTPRLYGESVPEHLPVTGWRSGIKIGCKEFSKGLSHGVVDILVQPCKGAREDGALGFVAGLGKGTVGTATKISAGSLSIWAYPAQGVWKSISNVKAKRSRVRSEIVAARRAHDQYCSDRDRRDENKVLADFDTLVKRRRWKWIKKLGRKVKPNKEKEHK